MEMRNSSVEFSRACLILRLARGTSFSPVCEKLRSKKLHQSRDIQSRWHGRTVWKKSTRVLFSHSRGKRKKKERASKFLNLKIPTCIPLSTSNRTGIYLQTRSIEKEICYRVISRPRRTKPWCFFNWKKNPIHLSLKRVYLLV